jgi:RimJ/RimL family protein N-acetyltransferase
MKLRTPSKTEARILLSTPVEFTGIVVLDGSLPPAPLFEAAIASEEDVWTMPRLYHDEDAGMIVGAGGFKSAPKEGKVEIGYGVAPCCRGRGYATAGVRLLVAHAFASGAVGEIMAETLIDNLASQKVLMKAGFSRYDIADSEEGLLILWKITKLAASRQRRA